MILLPLILLVVFILIVTSMARRAALRAREQAELEQSRGPEDPQFPPSPFGSLLGELMSGGLARSYTYDQSTGEWVDVSREQPPAPTPEQEDRARTNGHKQKQRPRRRQAPP